MARLLCKWCERKPSLSSMDYCSLEHLKLDMEYRKINLPKLFLLLLAPVTFVHLAGLNPYSQPKCIRTPSRKSFVQNGL
jgi:hypothetical protein